MAVKRQTVHCGCGLAFNNNTAAYEHVVETGHLQGKSCSLCCHVFANKDALKAHVNSSPRHRAEPRSSLPLTIPIIATTASSTSTHISEKKPTAGRMKMENSSNQRKKKVAVQMEKKAAPSKSTPANTGIRAADIIAPTSSFTSTSAFPQTAVSISSSRIEKMATKQHSPGDKQLSGSTFNLMAASQNAAATTKTSRSGRSAALVPESTSTHKVKQKKNDANQKSSLPATQPGEPTAAPPMVLSSRPGKALAPSFADSPSVESMPSSGKPNYHRVPPPASFTSNTREMHVNRASDSKDKQSAYSPHNNSRLVVQPTASPHATHPNITQVEYSWASPPADAETLAILQTLVHSPERLRMAGYSVRDPSYVARDRIFGMTSESIDWIVAPSPDPSSPRYAAIVLDCEMVETEARRNIPPGARRSQTPSNSQYTFTMASSQDSNVKGNGSRPESSSARKPKSTGRQNEIVRLTAIDFLTGSVLIDTLIQTQHYVVNWLTRYSGVSYKSFKNAQLQGRVLPSLAAARSALLALSDTDTILIGHALHNDLRPLGISHTQIVDTAILTAEAVFGAMMSPGRNWSLKTLCKDLVGLTVQNAGKKGHDSVEDTLATREVCLWCLREKEKLSDWATKQRDIWQKEKDEREEKKRKERQAKAEKIAREREEEAVGSVGTERELVQDWDDGEDVITMMIENGYPPSYIYGLLN
ncbi:hypothetical protein F5Y15DRAFT_110969 [Xylariaceae sp. FL0016]|nr:hypothetical protein F5Y15DRAFT_110969 [Xylariaceae sp. FL0016]